MKIQTRIFFGDDNSLDTTASFDEFCRGVSGKSGRDQTYLVRDKTGREYLIPWSAVQLVKNLNNRYDKLLEHWFENSEVGIAADFVHNLPYFWKFPQTDDGYEVWAWIEEHQCYFPKEFQPIYIKIANILMKEWDVDDVQGKNEELQKNAGFYVGLDWENDTDLTDLYKFLRSKMPEIERQCHDEEDKR